MKGKWQFALLAAAATTMIALATGGTSAQSAYGAECRTDVTYPVGSYCNRIARRLARREYWNDAHTGDWAYAGSGVVGAALAGTAAAATGYYGGDYAAGNYGSGYAAANYGEYAGGVYHPTALYNGYQDQS